MKNFINLCLLVGALFLSSCETDPCNNVACGDQGTCDAGICVCEAGYEQDADGLCNTEMRQKFIGNYSLTETCTTGSDSYNCDITASTQGVMKIVLGNLYDAGVAVTADLNTSTTFTIPDNTPFGTGTIAGTGSYDATNMTVTVTYTFTDALGNDDSCTATLSPL